MLKFLIPILLISIAIILIKYDRSHTTKSRIVAWLSRNVFRDPSGVNASAERLHQTMLGSIFIFCVGISALFLIGLFEEYF